MTRLPVIAVLIVASACSKKAEEKPITITAAPVPSASAVPVAAQLETPLPSAARPSPLPPIETKVANAALETHFVLTHPHTLSVHAIRGALLASSGDDVFRLVNGKLEDLHVSMPAGSRLEEWRTISGSWPESLTGIAHIAEEQGRAARGIMYGYSDCVVTGTPDEVHCDPDNRAMPMASSKGRLLALQGAHFAVIAGKKDLPVPKIAESDGGLHYHPQAFASLADGRVVAVGHRVGDDTMAEAQIWGPADEEAPLLPLPDSVAKDTEFRVLLAQKNVAYVIARDPRGGTVFRSEGGAFRKLVTPVPAETYGSALEAGHRLWIVNTDGKGGAYRLDGDQWTPVRVPDEGEVRAHVKNPDGAEPLSLKVTSIAWSEGTLYLGATILSGKDRDRGGAILALGPDDSPPPAPPSSAGATSL